MSWNFKKELTRKFIHFLSIFILVIYYFAVENFSRQIGLLILVLLLIVLLEFEYFRIEIGKEIPFLNRLWEYRRKKEKDKFGGDIFFLIGAILALSVLDLRVASAVILMTTFGDLSAALIGQKFGRHWISKERAWEGILAEFFIDLIIGFVIFYIFGAINFMSIVVIFVMAVTATVVESLVYRMDDNLLIPVFAGFNGQVALMILEYVFRIILVF